MRTRLLALPFGALGLFVCSCTIEHPHLDAPPSEPITVSYDLPKLTPEAETKNPQRQGGVVVTLEPVLFAASRSEGRTEVVNVVDSDFFHESAVLTRQTPAYGVSPDTVTFKIRIHNELERVLRLDGTVVVFRVDGTDVAVPRQNYEELLRGMITPRGEREFTLVGPRRDQLPSSCLIGVLLFDVVTGTDPAGVATVRSNFEWYFRCAVERQTGRDEVRYQVQMVDWPQVQCAACGGSGNGGYRTCWRCEGAGVLVDDGEARTCPSCEGSRRTETQCPNCRGERVTYQRPSYPRGAGQR